MTATVAWDDVEVGTELPARTVPRARGRTWSGTPAPPATSTRSTGTSGSPARSACPDVIAHGMFTMAEAGRVLTDWAGDPGAVVEYGVRFTRPVVVPDDDGSGDLGDRAGRREARRPAGAGGADRDQCGGDVLARSEAVVRLR